MFRNKKFESQIYSKKSPIIKKKTVWHGANKKDSESSSGSYIDGSSSGDEKDETEKKKSSKTKKKGRRDTLARDAKDFYKRANSDRTMFQEKDNNDLLPVEGAVLKEHYSIDDFEDTSVTSSVFSNR